jgi:hypothetical protein
MLIFVLVVVFIIIFIVGVYMCFDFTSFNGVGSDIKSYYDPMLNQYKKKFYAATGRPVHIESDARMTNDDRVAAGLPPEDEEIERYSSSQNECYNALRQLIPAYINIERNKTVRLPDGREVNYDLYTKAYKIGLIYYIDKPNESDRSMAKQSGTILVTISYNDIKSLNHFDKLEFIQRKFLTAVQQRTRRSY